MEKRDRQNEIVSLLRSVLNKIKESLSLKKE